MYIFKDFSIPVSAQFEGLCNSPGELYVTDVSGDGLYNYYLDAYPDGTNAMFRSRREYDCSCCKNFIRNCGNVVVIDNGQLVSVWDVSGLTYPYNVVAEKMAAYVKSRPIRSIFRAKESLYGAKSTKELVGDKVTEWHHFCGRVKSRFVSSSPSRNIGESDSNMQVMRRGLLEISLESIETILSLISENALYRGEEHTKAVTSFKELKLAYDAAPDKELFLWMNFNKPAARFRNTVIGTLATDLSEGVDLEKAVRSFESKVAPANYKRPKALITPAMVKDALKTIAELGIEDSLKRRYARISDVLVRDVLFVDNEVRGQMLDGSTVATLLMAQAKGKVPNLKDATPITINAFMAEVVPKTTSIELLMEGRHLGNLVSLTAPVHADAPGIFKWDNNFAWSYRGNVTDGIKERVKTAGGNVTAPLRVSLGWFNTDDLDLHVIEPGGRHIYFGNKSGTGKYAGSLDIDMNMGAPLSRTPVENVCWTCPRAGVYKVTVNNYNRRESIDVGFVLEVEAFGEIKQYHYPYPLLNKENVDALTITVKGSAVTIEAHGKVKEGSPAQEEWGIKTDTLTRVDSIMLSPNYWGEQGVGNKHWFFILKGCLNPEATRGLYNEFLASHLDKHRKVFEVLGDQIKAQPTPDQLSGLGFSSTKGDKVRVLVHGPSSRAYEINF